jgi:hypothetical protein
VGEEVGGDVLGKREAARARVGGERRALFRVGERQDAIGEPGGEARGEVAPDGHVAWRGARGDQQEIEGALVEVVEERHLLFLREPLDGIDDAPAAPARRARRVGEGLRQVGLACAAFAPHVHHALGELAAGGRTEHVE